MRMKKLILSLIKLIPLTFILFSFVACGGGGSSGGGDDWYEEPEISAVDEVVNVPAEADDADGSIRMDSPRYSGLPVTLTCNGVTLSQPATGSNVLNYSITRGQEAAFVVQQEYETYEWFINANGVTPGTIQDEGRTFRFTPEQVGNMELRVLVTNNGSRGSLNVQLVISE